MKKYYVYEWYNEENDYIFYVGKGCRNRYTTIRGRNKEFLKYIDMGNFTFKGMLLATVFMLLGCLSIQAGDDGLITKQITVTLDKAGTLQNKIGSAKKYKITNLKIVGEINGTDWRMIRDMAGRSVHHEETEGYDNS